MVRKLARDLKRRNVLPPKEGERGGRRRGGGGGVQSRKNHPGKRSQSRIQCLRRSPKEGTNSGRGGRSGICVQQSAVQTADGTPCAK